MSTTSVAQLVADRDNAQIALLEALEAGRRAGVAPWADAAVLTARERLTTAQSALAVALVEQDVPNEYIDRLNATSADLIARESKRIQGGA